MEASKHNIIGKLKDSDDYYIVNPLSRQADIITEQQAKEIESGQVSNLQELVQKGYFIDPQEEKARYTKEYLDFLDSRETDEVQIFYVPTYACNFACTYCYQEGYDHPVNTRQPEVIDAFFTYIDAEFAGRSTYITVFGGEPLLPGSTAKDNVSKLIAGAIERSLPLAFVTNGYALDEYIPLFEGAFIKELQVTLDGPRQVHDSRRMLKGGGASFDKIVTGIDAALEKGYPINIRAVVDRENLPYLPELAQFAIDKGWTDNPLFKTQLGRNYELHVCQADQSKLYDRLSLYEEVYQMVGDHPEFMQFHRPSYSLSKFLFEHGEMPDPLFDSCPGCKTEWAFDFTGRIYSCTATVGKDDEVLGTFYPDVSRKEEIIEQWEERDVTTIPECAGCALQLACGGGCASVAKNRTGEIHSPDCRPVRELIGLGIPLYFSETGDR
ncbi:MAG: radical SAM protein [Spirochaetota bacterium]